MNHIQTGSQLSQYPHTNFAKTALRLQVKISALTLAEHRAHACVPSALFRECPAAVCQPSHHSSAGFGRRSSPPRSPPRTSWSKGCLHRLSVGQEGRGVETQAPRGLSHAFAHSSRMELWRSAVPAEEVSIAPGGAGLGPFPKSETLPLSSSFTLPLSEVFLFLHHGSASLRTFAT